MDMFRGRKAGSAFGELEIDGQRFTHDVVVEGGEVRKRRKGPSKAYKARYGHTPLSADEAIPWSSARLIIGTGASGQLPVMDEVYAEAGRRGVEIVALPDQRGLRAPGSR